MNAAQHCYTSQEGTGEAAVDSELKTLLVNHSNIPGKESFESNDEVGDGKYACSM